MLNHIQVLQKSIYLPSALGAIALGAALVLTPLYILDLGFSAAVAALVFGCRGLGTMAAALPGGKFISRFGERNTMLAGTFMVATSYLVLATSSNAWLLGAGSFFVGAGSSFNLLARQSYLTERYKPGERGRIIAVLAGMMRIGNFIGPLAGGFIVVTCGYQALFLLLALLCLLSLLLVCFYVEKSTCAHKEAHASQTNTLKILKDHKQVFLTSGLCMLSLQFMRASRSLLIPLLGSSLNLNLEVITTIAAVGSAIDLLLFYPSGIVMDRWGRKAAAIPCFLIFGLGLCSMAFIQSETGLLMVSASLGLANGLSAGLILTLGSDYAPHGSRGAFLGVWRLVSDLGVAFAPACISLIIKISSIGFSGLVSGMTGVAATAVMLSLIKEPLNHSRANETTEN